MLLILSVYSQLQTSFNLIPLIYTSYYSISSSDYRLALRNLLRSPLFSNPTLHYSLEHFWKAGRYNDASI